MRVARIREDGSLVRKQRGWIGFNLSPPSAVQTKPGRSMRSAGFLFARGCSFLTQRRKEKERAQRCDCWSDVRRGRICTECGPRRGGVYHDRQGTRTKSRRARERSKAPTGRSGRE